MNISMELKLTPEVYNEKVYEGEGGSYYSWSPSKSPMLSEAKVGGGRLSLHPLGFALPHYADSSKIGYLIQGSCTVGLVYPNERKEKVVTIEKGDAILVRTGVVSWWYNGGDEEAVIVFLGETSKAYTPGEFAYFFMGGTLGMMGGFSTEFVSRLSNMPAEGANKLVKSQPGTVIVKLQQPVMNIVPSCQGHNKDGLVFGLEKAEPDVVVKNGGVLTNLTEAKLGSVGEVGVSGKLVKLQPNAMIAPSYSADSSVQVTYIIRGSGKLQIVGLNGTLVLDDANVHSGQLFVVPKFFMAAIIAGDEGLEYFSIVTAPRVESGQLGGSTSVWKALSPQVVEATLNIDEEFQKLFLSHINKTNLIIPPPPTTTI